MTATTTSMTTTSVTTTSVTTTSVTTTSTIMAAPSTPPPLAPGAQSCSMVSPSSSSSPLPSSATPSPPPLTYPAQLQVGSGSSGSLSGSLSGSPSGSPSGLLSGSPSGSLVRPLSRSHSSSRVEAGSCSGSSSRSRPPLAVLASYHHKPSLTIRSTSTSTAGPPSFVPVTNTTWGTPPRWATSSPKRSSSFSKRIVSPEQQQQQQQQQPLSKTALTPALTRSFSASDMYRSTTPTTATTASCSSSSSSSLDTPPSSPPRTPATATLQPTTTLSLDSPHDETKAEQEQQDEPNEAERHAPDHSTTTPEAPELSAEEEGMAVAATTTTEPLVAPAAVQEQNDSVPSTTDDGDAVNDSPASTASETTTTAATTSAATPPPPAALEDNTTTTTTAPSLLDTMAVVPTATTDMVETTATTTTTTTAGTTHHVVWRRSLQTLHHHRDRRPASVERTLRTVQDVVLQQQQQQQQPSPSETSDLVAATSRATLRVLEAYPSCSDIQAAACSVVSNLAWQQQQQPCQNDDDDGEDSSSDTPDSLPHFTQQALPKVLNALHVHARDYTVVVAALQACANLVPTNNATMTKTTTTTTTTTTKTSVPDWEPPHWEPVIHQVVQLLRQHATTVTTMENQPKIALQEAACTVLLNMAAASTSATTTATTTTSWNVQTALGAAGGVQALVATLGSLVPPPSSRRRRHHNHHATKNDSATAATLANTTVTTIHDDNKRNPTTTTDTVTPPSLSCALGHTNLVTTTQLTACALGALWNTVRDDAVNTQALPPLHQMARWWLFLVNKHAWNPTVQTAGCGIIQQRLKNNTSITSTRDDGVASPVMHTLLQAVHNHSHTSGVQEQAWGALWNATANRPVWAREFVLQGGLPEAWRILQQFTTTSTTTAPVAAAASTHTLTTVCGCLMSVVGSLPSKAAKTLLHQHVPAPDGILSLLRVMHRHTHHTTLQVYACGALMNWAVHHPPTRHTILFTPLHNPIPNLPTLTGLTLLLRALQTHVEEQGVVLYGCGALWNVLLGIKQHPRPTDVWAQLVGRAAAPLPESSSSTTTTTTQRRPWGLSRAMRRILEQARAHHAGVPQIVQWTTKSLDWIRTVDELIQQEDDDDGDHKV